MNHAEIYRIALAAGFKLKQQPDGTMDLNPYVYRFAEALLEQGRQVALYHRERAERFQAERDDVARKWEEEKAAMEAQVESLRRDKDRLDWFDKLNRALNRHYGTTYRWKVVTNHNVNRLFLGPNLGACDMHDTDCNGLPSCRDAIDEVMRRMSEEAPSCD